MMRQNVSPETEIGEAKGWEESGSLAIKSTKLPDQWSFHNGMGLSIWVRLNIPAENTIDNRPCSALLDVWCCRLSCSIKFFNTFIEKIEMEVDYIILKPYFNCRSLCLSSHSVCITIFNEWSWLHKRENDPVKHMPYPRNLIPTPLFNLHNNFIR